MSNLYHDGPYVGDGGVWAPSDTVGLRMMSHAETAAKLNAQDAEIARLRDLLKRTQDYIVPLASWSDSSVAEAKALADDIAATLSPDPVEGEKEGVQTVVSDHPPSGRGSLPAPSGWLPIETAPKDGTDILLGAPSQTFEGKPTAPRVTIGHWTTEEECRVHMGDCGGECRCPEYEEGEPSWISWDGGFTAENPATHWQPLPGAPPPCLTMECPRCKRLMADVAREPTDPSRAVRVVLICPDCDDGDRHTPTFFDAEGREVLWFEGLEPAPDGAERVHAQADPHPVLNNNRRGPHP